MNKIPDCSKCERCKSMEYLFDDYYCYEENEPTQIYGLLGAYYPPETSPIWCPKKAIGRHTPIENKCMDIS